MTDLELVAKRLAFIETCVDELRRLARPEQVQTDVREERFVEHTLQLAIQAILDVASHIVSDERMGEPRTNRELVELLDRHGWLSGEVARSVAQMVAFRNILVHGYTEVDPSIVEDVLRNHLDELLAFVSAVRRRLAEAAGHDR